MFDFCQNVTRPPHPCGRDNFKGILADQHVAATCASILKATNEEDKVKLKRTLPAFLFHAHFPSGRRANKRAVPSGLCIYDVDHLDNPRQYYDEHVKGREEQLGVVFAHVSASGHGLRLVFVLPSGMSLAAAQRWMATQLGDAEYDQSVKDLARASFAVPWEYVIYLDEDELFRDRGTVEVPANEPVPTSDDGQTEDRNVAPVPVPTSAEATTEDKWSRLIATWWAAEGGEPQPGERNTRLHRLAWSLRPVMGEKDCLAVLPRLGLPEQEVKALVRSAYMAPSAPLGAQMRHALELCGMAEETLATPELPALPDVLPPLVELLLRPQPALYRPAVASAIFPPLATHLHGVTFRYVNNAVLEATLMNCLVAETGAGKSCVNEPIDLIMSDIRERDAVNRQREAQWKADCRAVGNGKRPARPDDLAVQWISPDITNAAFVMRLKDAEGKFLYSRLNEIDAFDALKGSARNPQQFHIMCLAFDTSIYGQERVGAESVSEQVKVRWNWNCSTTPAHVREYFSRVLTDGPVQRISFATIEEQPIGSPIPIFGTYDDAIREELRPYIARLLNARGEVDCPEARELTIRLLEETGNIAFELQDRVYGNFSYRANIIAYLKACVLYVANGCVWDATFEPFVRWSLHYDLCCKMMFFSDAIRKLQSDGRTHYRRNNLLCMLPKNFTFDDVKRLRMTIGQDARGTQGMIYRWLERGHIRRTDGQNNYVKL